MKRDEIAVLDLAKETLAQWLDGTYFAAPPDHTGLSANDWVLDLQETHSPVAPLVFRERTTGHSYRIELRVTRI